MNPRWVAIWCAVAVLAVSGVDRFLDRTVQKLVVTFFDVGQGDSIGIQFPGGKTMLVDAPGGWGGWNAGEMIVIPELLRKGMLSLDYIVMSHPDRDHSQGLIPIVNQLSVAEFLYHSVFNLEKTVEVLKTGVQKYGRLSPVERETTIDVGGASVKFIPMNHSCTSGCKDNNQSLLVEISFAGCRVLLTGDIEKEAEREWLHRYGMKLDLLKVAHHGSKSSSIEEFLRAARPQIAVASVGWRNRYHHPHPTVVRRYRELGIPLLRTDTDGFVEVRIDPGGSMECNSWHGPCGVYRCSGNSSLY